MQFIQVFTNEAYGIEARIYQSSVTRLYSVVLRDYEAEMEVGARKFGIKTKAEAVAYAKKLVA